MLGEKRAEERVQRLWCCPQSREKATEAAGEGGVGRCLRAAAAGMVAKSWTGCFPKGQLTTRGRTVSGQPAPALCVGARHALSGTLSSR